MKDIRPTAKWANRMLRPLTSIYRRLEKRQENLSAIASLRAKERAETVEAVPTRGAAFGAEERYIYLDGDGEADGDDPAWVPGKLDKRRIRHKYSTRGEGNGSRPRNRVAMGNPEAPGAVLPGAIELATPLITGKTREAVERSCPRRQQTPRGCQESSNGRKRTRRTNQRHFPAYQGSWKEILDMSGDAELIDIAHLLDRIFIKFLSNTRATVSPWQQGRGAGSLLSMAARRLPVYIAEEQRIQDESEENEDVDMCDAYFYELEAHYAPAGNGWAPLRDAVRAQGIYLASEMLEKRWLTNLAACRLLEECMNHQELDAFQALSSRYLATIDSYEYPPAFDPPRVSTHRDDAIQLLGIFYSRHSGRRSFVFDEMAKLLLREVVPPEWMVTKMWKRCVDGAITSLSTADDNSVAATRLIEAVILAAGNSCYLTEAVHGHGKRLNSGRTARSIETRTSGNLPRQLQEQSRCPVPIQDALSNLTLSLVAALCGIHIARTCNQAAEERAVGLKMREFVRSLALSVQREAEMKPLSDKSDDIMLYNLRRGSVLLGECLLQCSDESETICWPDSVSSHAEKFFRSLSTRQDMVKELATLTRQVFRCYEHIHQSNRTRTSREVRCKVSQLAHLTDVPGLSVFLGKVAAETAMGLAETTVDPDDHVWAVDIQESVASSLQELDTKCDPTRGHAGHTGGLYRWEDSIGEWVASTPMWKLKAVVEVPSRNAGAARRSPSTIADSTCSDSPSSSPGDSASSATSSAPSVSLKRARSASESRPNKRPRPAPVEVFSEASDSSDAESATESQTSGSSSASPVARRTRRCTLGELMQARGRPKRMATRSMKPTGQDLRVVINRKKDYSEDEDSQSSEDHDVMAPRPRPRPRGRPPKAKHPRKRTAPIVPRAPSKRAMIPCSQDDSDDELSFF